MKRSAISQTGGALGLAFALTACAPVSAPNDGNVRIAELSAAIVGSTPILAAGSTPEAYRWTKLRAHVATKQAFRAASLELLDVPGAVSGLDDLLAGLNGTAATGTSDSLPSTPGLGSGRLGSAPSVGEDSIGSEPGLGSSGSLPPGPATGNATLSINPALFSTPASYGTGGDFATGYCAVFGAVIDLVIRCADPALDPTTVTVIQSSFGTETCRARLVPALGTIPAEVNSVVTPILHCMADKVDTAACGTDLSTPIESALQNCGIDINAVR